MPQTRGVGEGAGRTDLGSAQVLAPQLRLWGSGLCRSAGGHPKARLSIPLRPVFHHWGKVLPRTVSPHTKGPPAGGPPPRTVLSQSLGLTPAHLHARFHWLRTHRLGPGFPGCGGGAWGARFWGDHAGWDGGWHWALRALGWLSGRLALLGHSGEPEG